MRVEFEDHPRGGTVIMTLGFASELVAVVLTPHDERDIAAALAERHAMARICGREHGGGEHTCSSRPDHTDDHACRACTFRWQRTVT